MATTYHQEPGRLVIECAPAEVPTLLTQSELARAANRSPAFVQAKVAEGVIAPAAETGTGIRLFTLNSLPPLVRPTVLRDGRHVETTALR